MKRKASGSSLHGSPQGENGTHTMRRLTAEEIAEIEGAAPPDDRIDMSDIPELIDFSKPKPHPLGER